MQQAGTSPIPDPRSEVGGRRPSRQVVHLRLTLKDVDDLIADLRKMKTMAKDKGTIRGLWRENERGIVRFEVIPKLHECLGLSTRSRRPIRGKNTGGKVF